MISYPFIEQFFKNILSKSRAIEGRFFLCPRSGQEMNSDELEQVIKDLVIPEPLVKKYPLALMMPPTIRGNYYWKKSEGEEWRITIFFLKTTFYVTTESLKSGITHTNTKTNTSTHTVIQDWHDMKRAAENFLRVLDRISRRVDGGLRGKLIFKTDQDQQISEVSKVGADQASGVRLDFTCLINNGCELEDYSEDEVTAIVVPEDDPHPEHAL